jgi:hypothetical protein
MFTIFTLDSHDYYGPFSTEAAAHEYAKDHGLTSYQLIRLRDSGSTLDY